MEAKTVTNATIDPDVYKDMRASRKSSIRASKDSATASKTVAESNDDSG